ncbi:MAG: hypothetical protein ACRD19_01835 [Terriglobia bacterium]
MISAKGFVVLAMAVGGIAGPASSMELQGATTCAWREYVRAADARMQARLVGDKPFLWIDDTAERELHVRRGDIVIAPVVGHGTKSVHDGLIHDWIGGVFIPNATMDSLLAVVRDYGKYKEIYKPVVTDSQLLTSSSAGGEFSMVWQRHVVFITSAIQARFKARDFVVDSRRGYSVINATRIQQIEEYGHPGEHLCRRQRQRVHLAHPYHFKI